MQTHPVHFNDPLHKHSDLIYTDILEHVKRNKSLTCIVDYYEKYFDLDYAKFVHSMICEKIETILENYSGQILHITNVPWDGLYQFDDMMNFDWAFRKHQRNGSGSIRSHQRKE